MPCKDPLCRLNETLLALLSELAPEQQQHILRQWPKLKLRERDALLRELREPEVVEADLVTLAKLADYFRCGVYDMVRYTRLEEPHPGRD